MRNSPPLKIAVIGTGISGLSAAWLLSRAHQVTVYEQDHRTGGHANTVFAGDAGQQTAVDTGFIVFNRRTYPNFSALLDCLGVATHKSDMSFGVSLDGGTREYSTTGALSLLAQPSNLASPRFWSMMNGMRRFYRDATRDAGRILDGQQTLSDYVEAGGFGTAFRDDHLMPMASAIWCTSPSEIMAYPAAAFLRFNQNHGLLQWFDRPVWETVTGGSRRYVEQLTRPFAKRIRTGCAVLSLRRLPTGVALFDSWGRTEHFDQVVLATHADQALAILADTDGTERSLLGAFRYSDNLAVLHRDPSFMPRRRAAWSSWNYVGPRGGSAGAYVTYWMNRLQGIRSERPLFVTLNPPREPRGDTAMWRQTYAHPIFDARAMAAQRQLWSLQGRRNTWFCGAYFGSGFHEDGLQAGLAVAEQLGGVRRPWSVPDQSGRIFVGDPSVGPSTVRAA